MPQKTHLLQPKLTFVELGIKAASSQSFQYDAEMLLMFFFTPGVYEYIINEYHHKFVQEVHEDLVHHSHEVSWGIRQTKRHDREFIQAISGGECRLGDIFLPDLQLIIAGTKIYLGEYLGSLQLIKQIINAGQRVLVLNGDFI